MTSFETLKKRKDFLRVARGIKVVTSSIILQAAQSLCAEKTNAKIGFTTSKKIGKAVERNRARRRMRALVREFLPVYAMDNVEYVFVGRHNTATADYALLQKDMKYGLNKVRKLLQENDAE